MARAEFEWFQWSKERESAGPNMLVSILGPQSVGKTTLAGQLEDKLGFHLITEEWKHLAYLMGDLIDLKQEYITAVKTPMF